MSIRPGVRYIPESYTNFLVVTSTKGLLSEIEDKKSWLSIEHTAFPNISYGPKPSVFDSATANITAHRYAV